MNYLSHFQSSFLRLVHVLTRINSSRALTMDKITDFRIEKLENSAFVKPMRIRYKQNGREKIWDLVQTHQSVYVVIFNKSRSKLVLVKQFRPTVYFQQLKSKLNIHSIVEGETLDTSVLSGNHGLTLELCAGIVDKSKPLQEIAQDEVWEECGYEVPLNNISTVMSCFGSVGLGGERMSVFYAEVTDEMKKGSGGGLESEGEMIEVIELGIQDVRELMTSGNVDTSPSTLFGLTWFLLNKAQNV